MDAKLDYGRDGGALVNRVNSGGEGRGAADPVWTLGEKVGGG